MQKKLPIDVSTFKIMIEENYLYIDKTQSIYNLIKNGRYFFLSRPRRFGKSLLISTLKEIFVGNKKLFKDLWIDSSDYEWHEYPVIDLDFSRIAHGTVDELRASLIWTLTNIAQDYEIDISQAPTLSDKLSYLIKRLSLINKVVMIIDEYDKPILDHLQNPKDAHAQRELLKSFYDPLKSMDAYLRAIFITGVTKFSKTSLFSGMNNLNDISLDPKAAQLLGYTQEEIDKYFLLYLEDFAQKKEISIQALLLELKKWYNGYRFSEEAVKVYNPFSVLYALEKKKFLNYWYQSGTPTFLVHLIEKQYGSIELINQAKIDQDSLGNFEINNIPLIPLLFQTGYLTISNYDKETGNFALNFPNFEVELSFTKFLVITLTQTSSITLNTLGSQLIQALNNNEIEKFCSVLQTLFAHIPYPLIKTEAYYHVLFQFLLSLLSLEAQSELFTDKGRIDLVLSTASHTYIFELKLKASPKVALAQIKQRGYYQRFLHKSKHVVLVGLSFISEDNQISLRFIQELIRPI